MTAWSRVLGIDFSGAKDAGNKIWIAEAIVNANGIEIESCMPVRKLPGGASDRDSALQVLVEYLAEQSGSLAGLDFPFSLPARLIRERNWKDFISTFPQCYPSPEFFRINCTARGGGYEIKRKTDLQARVPFSAYNLRLYRQTYWGIRDVLYPLITNDAVRVIPIQTPCVRKPVIAEICPASILKREGLYCSYKGRGQELREARQYIMEQLIKRRVMRRPGRSILNQVLDNAGGDALDSVIATIGAARVIMDLESMRARDVLDLVEGRVYF